MFIGPGLKFQFLVFNQVSEAGLVFVWVFEVRRYAERVDMSIDT